MTNSIDTLRSIASDYDVTAFVQMCDAAKAGEGWAVSRLIDVQAQIDALVPSRKQWAATVEIIRTTDCTRPSLRSTLAITNDTLTHSQLDRVQIQATRDGDHYLIGACDSARGCSWRARSEEALSDVVAAYNAGRYFRG